MKILPRLAGKQILRSIGLGVLADYTQYKLGHPFNQSVPRRVYRFHKGWLNIPDYIKEADAACAAYDGGDFIDVGAAKGVYPLFLAPRARNAKFLLLEPDPAFLMPLLQTVNSAMDNYPGFVPYIVPAGAGETQHHRMQFDTNERTFFADIVRIDDLVKTLAIQPSFVKIDVDGPEYFVLRGMKDSIAEFRPSVLLEMHYSCWKHGETEADIFAQLPDYDFDLIWESFWRNDPRERCARYMCTPRRFEQKG